MSETDTIRIRTQPTYHRDRSSPERNYWFFSYTIEIANQGDRRVQLMSRHWRITDGTAMEGSYTMRRDDGSLFEAPIGVFVLEDPESVN